MKIQIEVKEDALAYIWAEAERQYTPAECIAHIVSDRAAELRGRDGDDVMQAKQAEATWQLRARPPESHVPDELSARMREMLSRIAYPRRGGRDEHMTLQGFAAEIQGRFTRTELGID